MWVLWRGLPLPTDWESPYTQLLKIWRKSARIRRLAGNRVEDAKAKERFTVKVSIGRYVMRYWYSTDEPLSDIILDVECNSADPRRRVRLYVALWQKQATMFKRPVIVYIDGGPEYEDPLPDGTLETLAEVLSMLMMVYLEKRTGVSSGRTNTWKRRVVGVAQQMVNEKFYVGMFYNFIWRALVPRRNGSWQYGHDTTDYWYWWRP